MARRVRRRAAVEQLTESPALVATLMFGLVLVVVGVLVPDAVRGVALCVAGTALITVFCLYPLVDAASVGSGTVRWKAHRTTESDIVKELYGPYRDELRRIARDISGQHKVGSMVHEAMQIAYADSGLIPREKRREHLFCELVAIARERSNHSAESHGRDPHGPNDPVSELSLDERCAYVLWTSEFLSDDSRADVLHMTLDAYSDLVALARSHLTDMAG